MLPHRKGTIMTGAIIVAVLVIAVVTAIMAVKVSKGIKVEIRPTDTEFHSELLGENVYIFSPEDSHEDIQKVVDEINKAQEPNHFGNNRYALMFLPGDYGDDIDVSIGFMTQVAGLGITPVDTSIGKVECLARWHGNDPNNHNACVNFWRSIENLHMKKDTTWAVSQGTDMRRVKIDGSLALHDEHGWCSGGFLADSYITGTVDSGTQQQWLSRNCNWDRWIGQNWNMVFVGTEEGAAPEGEWPVNAYTKVDKTDISREKPFLIYDEKMGYGVYVPAVVKDSRGTSWEQGVDVTWCVGKTEINPEKDCILPIDRFYVAQPSDNVTEINAALEIGKHLLLTPGVYKFDEPIRITNDNTVCLGLGMATIVNTESNASMEIEDRSGVVVAGILFDAGNGNADYLLKVHGDDVEKAYPICLSDIYTRIGGMPTPEPARVDTTVVIDADYVVGDNFWLWRADHGNQVGWDKNATNTGIVVNGNNVTTYALMVEHFEKYQTIWNGNAGRIYMYQSEIPYDVPSQEVWKSHSGAINGYSSIKVADEVTDFEGYGIGIYLFNRDVPVVLHSAMEVPDHKDVKVTNIITVMLTGHPGMEHIINEAGKDVSFPGATAVLMKYEDGKVSR